MSCCFIKDWLFFILGSGDDEFFFMFSFFMELIVVNIFIFVLVNRLRNFFVWICFECKIIVFLFKFEWMVFIVCGMDVIMYFFIFIRYLLF